jgi:hypothetical protein
MSRYLLEHWRIYIPVDVSVPTLPIDDANGSGSVGMILEAAHAVEAKPQTAVWVSITPRMVCSNCLADTRRRHRHES